MKYKVMVNQMISGVVEVDLDDNLEGVTVTNLTEPRCATHSYTINAGELEQQMRDELCAYASLKLIQDVLRAQRAEVRKLADQLPDSIPTPNGGAKA